METTPVAPRSKVMYWAGWVVSILPALLLLFSASMKFMQPAVKVDDPNANLGWPAQYMMILGIVEISCTIIYLVPNTAVLGAILLTGYLGGAVATHARLGQPAFAIAIVVGMLVWLGLFLRDARIRALVPWRS